MPLIPPVPPAPPLYDVVRLAFVREVSADSVSAGGEACERARLAAAARLSERVLVGMPTWFGTAGTYALASRALARVQKEQQLLTSVRLTSAQVGLRDVESAARTDGVTVTVEGILAFLFAFAEGLGRLVGDNLTARLFDECVLSDERSAPVPTTPLSPPRHTTDD
jgi:hypothetical protein